MSTKVNLSNNVAKRRRTDEMTINPTQLKNELIEHLASPRMPVKRTDTIRKIYHRLYHRIHQPALNQRNLTEAVRYIAKHHLYQAQYGEAIAHVARRNLSSLSELTHIYDCVAHDRTRPRNQYGNNLSIKQSVESYYVLCNIIINHLKNHRDVRLSGIGRIAVVYRKSRHWTNPNTKEPEYTPGHYVLVLRTSHKIKNKL